MSTNVYSLFMSILWCDIFTVVLFLFLRKKRFVVNFSVYPLLLLIVLSLLRLVVNVEFPNTPILHSDVIYPAVVAFMDSALFQSSSNITTIRVFDLCIIVWIIGSALLLIRLGVQELRFKKLIANEKATTDHRILSAIEQIVGKKKTKVSVIKTDLVSVPMITGLFRPTILLPQIPLSDTELYHVLLHEWTHYLHKDTWTKFLVKVLCSVYWWNPLVYLLQHDIDNVLESKIDLHLTRKMSEEASFDYLQALLTVARSLVEKKHVLSPVAIGLLPSKKEHLLEQRFHIVLEQKPLKSLQKLGIGLLSVLMLLTYISSYTFIIQPYTEPEELETNMIFDINPEVSYIIKNNNGTYSFYMNNTFMGEIQDINNLPDELLSTIKIIETEDTYEP